MRVQNKLLIVTLALVVLLIVVTGTLFYRYGEDISIERSTSQMRALADTISLQMESHIRQMDFALLFMLSEPDFLQALSYYTMPGRDNDDNRLLLSESSAVISRTMVNYAVNKNFYRATLFTADGDYFTSRYLEPTLLPSAVRDRLKGVQWAARARSLMGRMLILKPYSDPWSRDEINVFGVARAIITASGKTCFLEIQTELSRLDELLGPASSFGARSAILLSGEPFYAPEGLELAKGDISVSSEANQYEISIRVWQSREVALGLLTPMRLQIAALCLVALALSAAYLYFASRRITSPLRSIQASMEKTALDTLTNPPLPQGGDELMALNEAFLRLCERLKSAIDAQILSRERENRARLDSLQAQIDPHFLYNTLNVIAGRAMATGDDEIVSICEEIASMLRYSTDTARRESSIGFEAAHLTTYLALMKRRLKQKLEYTVEIAPEITDEPMPKIVLQQFAENAIHHGIGAQAGALRFELRGRAEENGWVIEIADDGKGFDAEVLSRLRLIMASDAPPLTDKGLSIGGMGIVNTWARLRTFYGESFTMTLENGDPGARIRLGAKYKEKRNANNDSR